MDCAISAFIMFIFFKEWSPDGDAVELLMMSYTTTNKQIVTFIICTYGLVM